jgi:hypothetical protein
MVILLQLPWITKSGQEPTMLADGFAQQAFQPWASRIRMNPIIMDLSMNLFVVKQTFD